MYSAQDLENKSQAQLVAILNDELGFSVSISQAKKLKNAGLRNMVLEAQEVEIAQQPEVQTHPEVESQLTSEEVMALEEKLNDVEEVNARQEVELVEIEEDEIMSPQELLVEVEEWFVMIPDQDPVSGFTSSTEAREFAEGQGLKQGTYSIRDKQYVGSRLSEDKLGRLLAEGLKEIADKHDKKAMASKKAGASTTRGNLYISPKDAAQIKPIKAGSKHHVLVTHLLQGATLTELAQATNWKPASVRSAFSYDINSIKGYGVRQEGDKFYLVMPAGVNAPVVQ